MKIENNALNSVSQNKKAEETRAVEYSQQRVESNRVEKSRDKAEFSESARLLAKARVSLSELSDVENKKVEELQRSIQNGTYNVPVQKLADQLSKYFKP